MIADSAQLLLGAQDWKTKIAEMLELLGQFQEQAMRIYFKTM